MKGNTLHRTPYEGSQRRQLNMTHPHLHCWPSQSGRETWSSEPQRPWGQLRGLAEWPHSGYGFVKPCYNVQSWFLSETAHISNGWTLGKEEKNNALPFVPTSVAGRRVQISPEEDSKFPAVDPGLYFHRFQTFRFQCTLRQIQFWTHLLRDESRGHRWGRTCGLLDRQMCHLRDCPALLLHLQSLGMVGGREFLTVLIYVECPLRYCL